MLLLSKRSFIVVFMMALFEIRHWHTRLAVPCLVKMKLLRWMKGEMAGRYTYCVCRSKGYGKSILRYFRLGMLITGVARGFILSYTAYHEVIKKQLPLLILHLI